ncbi:MAG: phytanoyl-CoA dioxygenase family protein [Acidobacteria bacterium]|nr:phytanoyl-CoA dioxygenase family protein [Acidobacteriota bacterium]
MAPSQNLAAEFETSGAAALGQVLDATQLPIAQAAFEEVMERGVTGPYARIVHDSWRTSPQLAALVPALGTLACKALGIPELVLFHDHLLSKPPNGIDMDWHQDFSYLPLDCADGFTLWIALDDVSPENGCLYYLYGSHLLGERRANWGMTGDDDPRAALPPIDIDPAEPGIAVRAPAGHGFAHHGYLWHRSPANRTSRPRRSWALSFVSPAARWSPGHAPHPRSAVEPRYEGQPMESDLIRVSAAPLLPIPLTY